MGTYILLAMSKKMLKIDGRYRVREFNLLKPSDFFTYHQVLTFKILHDARFVLSHRTDSDFCFMHH